MSKFTKKAILESFIKMLNEKPMDKITVKDIIEDCGINRSTFYYHFENVYDCLVCVLNEEAARLTEKHLEYSEWLDGIIEAMSFAMENRRAIFHIYKSVNRDELENYFYTIFDTVLNKIVEQNINTFVDGLNVTKKEIELIVNLYKYGITGHVFKWLKDGMPGELIDDIRILGVMLEGNIREMLEKASKNKNTNN